jgi:arylsulfatase A-like enzyme
VNDSASTPNVLVILTDQHRWDCLSVAGNPDVRTPNFDALADDGVCYENSFSSSPLCVPSRYSLLTGLQPHQHLGAENRSTLPAGLETFASVMRDAGHSTAAVGKMHLYPTYLDVGFQRMVLAEQDGDGRLRDDYHRDLREADLLDYIDLMDQREEYRVSAPADYWSSFGSQTSNLPEQWHSTTWITDRALAELSSWTSGGNLLTVSYIKPHHPFDPPAPWDELYNPDELTILPGWCEEIPTQDIETEGYFPNRRLTAPALRGVMSNYYGSISHVDHHIGRLVQYLKDRELYDKTLIVFTSDHGEYLGFHHLLLKHGHMYEPLVRVPLIIKYPSRERRGRDERLVSGTDLLPTILGAVGLPSSNAGSGRDLSDRTWTREFVYAESESGEYMIRTETHKLILHPEPSKSLLFDLVSDPLETNNLAHRPAERGRVLDLTHSLMNAVLFVDRPPTHRDGLAREIDAVDPSVATEMNTYMRERFDKMIAGHARA